MNPTHERIPRLAECIQWEGSNTQAVAEFLGRHGMTGTLYRDKFLTVRENGRVIHTMWPDSWVLEGEDGKIRFYTDYTFKSMYRLVRRKLPYLPSMTDEELISYLESTGGVSEVESHLLGRLKESIDRADGLEAQAEATRAEESLKEYEERET